MKSLRVFCAVLGVILPGFALGGPITVPSGGQFIASANACINIGSFSCPPEALMLAVYTQPTAGIAGYSLQAWLISGATGASYPIANNFVYFITSGSITAGIFGYNGLAAGFPFPSDPTFFGPNPATSTISILFQNTGLPFTFYADQLVDSITIDLDSNGTRWAVTTNSAAIVPEPSPAVLGTVGILFILALRLPLRRPLAQWARFLGVRTPTLGRIDRFRPTVGSTEVIHLRA